MKFLTTLFFISLIFASCSSDYPTPCDCKFITEKWAKNKDELTVNEQYLFYGECRPEYQIQKFIDPDKPYNWAVQEWRNYMQKNCPN